MEDIKLNIANNIINLRHSNDMTQSELAEKLNYSDKAVSKWERGLSVPDIGVLKEIADLFGVTIDFLVQKNEEQIPEVKNPSKTKFKNRSFITGMSIVVVWLVAMLIFVVFELISDDLRYHWLAFAYAIPASIIVWLVFNSVWFNARRNFLIISILMWSVLSVVHLTLLFCGFNTWLILILGIPGQIIIYMWSKIKLNKKDNKD